MNKTKHIINQLGLERNEFAKLMGVSPSAAYKWVHDVRTPNTTADKLMDVFLLLKTQHPETFDNIQKELRGEKL